MNGLLYLYVTQWLCNVSYESSFPVVVCNNINIITCILYIPYGSQSVCNKPLTINTVILNLQGSVCWIVNGEPVHYDAQKLCCIRLFPSRPPTHRHTTVYPRGLDTGVGVTFFSSRYPTYTIYTMYPGGGLVGMRGKAECCSLWFSCKGKREEIARLHTA